MRGKAGDRSPTNDGARGYGAGWCHFGCAALAVDPTGRPSPKFPFQLNVNLQAHGQALILALGFYSAKLKSAGDGSKLLA